MPRTPRITYALFNDHEPDRRLRDAGLFRELSRVLGDDIIGIEAGHVSSEAVVWGPDPFSQRRRRAETDASVYLDEGLMRGMGWVTAGARDVQAQMDRISAGGGGSIIRNLNRPNESLRYAQAGDRFSQHESAVTWSSDEAPLYLVQPCHGDACPRRFLVVDGEIVAHSPMSFDENAPLHIAPSDLGRYHAPDVFKPLERVDDWREILSMQTVAARRAITLLSRFDHGAIDVVTDRAGNAFVEAVHAGPPGSFDIWWADVTVYAHRVFENLGIVDPSLADDEAGPTGP